MLIVKTIQTYIDIHDHNDLFNPDLVSICKKLLSKRYCGRCYKACFIISILRINRVSEVYFTHTLNAFGSVCVNFDAEAIIYQEGEIIPDCKITHIETNGTMYGISKHTSIILNRNTGQANSTILSTVKKGDIIPIYVKLARNIPNGEKIAISGTGIIPMYRTPFIYNITRGLSSEEIKDLSSFVEKIKRTEDEIKELKEDEKKAYMGFKELLYPYRTKQEPDAEYKDFKEIDISEIYDVSMGRVSHPITLKQTKRIIYSPTDGGNTIDETLYNIITIMYNDYYKHILNLLSLSKTYANGEALNRNINIWKTYNILKR